MRVAEGPQLRPSHPNPPQNSEMRLGSSSLSALRVVCAPPAVPSVLIFSPCNRPNPYCSIKYNHLESSQVIHATSPPTTRSREHSRHQLSHPQTMDLSRQTQNRQNSGRPPPCPRI